MKNIIGYARVSTEEQKLFIQEDALKKYGCQKIFIEKVSGRKRERVVLKQVLSILKTGDVLAVWKLDRLARSTQQLIDISEKFRKEGITLVSIQENLDTITPLGRFYFTIMAAIAEVEVEIIRERTRAGMKAARARGKAIGRPHINNDIQTKIKTLYHHSCSINDIAAK